MKKLLSVKSIEPGDTIAAVSPSWAGPHAFPDVYNLGVKRLQDDFGLKIVDFPTTKAPEINNQSHPEERARDLAAAFNDRNVDGIICTIGGDDSLCLLPYLDKYDISPKFFMGYSDSTVLLHYFASRGFITFHGPTIMAGFAEPGAMRDEQTKHIKDFLFEEWGEYAYTPFANYTEEKMRWDDSSTLAKTRTYIESPSLAVDHSSLKSESLQGVLWGGSFEALEFIKGTKYWQNENNKKWASSIVFLEISDEVISLGQVRRIMRNYGVQNMFNTCSAIMFGRTPKSSTLKTKELREMITDVVRNEYKSNIPIIYGLDIGHTYPQQIFPIGVPATVTFKDKGVAIKIESPFLTKNI